MPRAAGHCPFRALWADGAGRRRQLAHALSLTRRTRSYSQLRAAVSAGAERARAHIPTPRGCSSPSPPSRTAVFPGLLGSVALLPPPHFLGGPGENGRGEAHPAPLCCRRVSMEAFGSAWEGETCRRALFALLFRRGGTLRAPEGTARPLRATDPRHPGSAPAGGLLF